MGTPVTLSLACPRCPNMTLVTVDRREIDAFHAGSLLQDAFPNLTPGERDAILFGYCLECQSALFPPEEEDE